jgi:dTDP-4-dehydrorhamnose reductase
LPQDTAVAGARFLVIGGAGLVGSHVLRALRGRTVTGTYHHAAYPGGVPLDVTDAKAVRERVHAARPDVVVLAAAAPYVERCEREPEATRAVNVEGTRAVAEAAAELSATLVVFSSEYVFDGARGEYSEDDPVAPLNEYGRQKAEIEEIARRSGRHLVCRTSGVFGAEAARKNFVFQLVDALRAGRPFIVPADQLITPTEAASLAGAVVELVDRGLSGTFHVAGPERLPRPEFAARVARAFGLDAGLLRSVPTSDLGLAARRPLRAGLRDDRLRAALGHGLTPVDDALRELAREAA